MLVSVSDDRAGRKGGLYRQTQQRVQHLFENWNFGITDFFMWTYDNVTKTEIYAQNRALFDEKVADMNGRAYKPLAIYHGLMELREGDFLIYADSSPEMWKGFDVKQKLPAGDYDLSVLKELVRWNRDVLSSYYYVDHKDPKFGLEKLMKEGYMQKARWRTKPANATGTSTDLGDHTHAYFTTDKCMQAMGLLRYRDSYQHSSAMIVLRKSPRTVRFVSNWLHWNLNPDCCTITPFWQEVDRKMGHRTDQSISGLLVNEMNGSLLVPLPLHKHHPTNFMQWSLTRARYAFIDQQSQDPAYFLLLTSYFLLSPPFSI